MIEPQPPGAFAARAYAAHRNGTRLRIASPASRVQNDAQDSEHVQASDATRKRTPRDAPFHDADASTGPDGRRPLRVYLVEDAPSFRDRLSDFLTESGGVEIAGFADSEAAALHDLRGAPPDVVIVDLHLREGSGIGVIESLRRQWPKQPPTIVVLTNYAFPEFETACRARGADHFYDKSTQFGAVKALLDSLRGSGA